jgi:hypothetical protein
VKVLLSLLLVSLSLSAAWSQPNIDSLARLGVCTPHGFTIPSITGMPRGKGVVVYQERTPEHQLKSSFENQDSTAEAQVRRTQNWVVKLRGPVVNKEHFKLIVGLQYAQQEFAFKNPSLLTNTFYQSLQDKPLRSAGLSVYSIKSFIGNKYLIGRATLRLNGDFGNGDLRAHLKSSFSVLYGIKHHARRSWGFGASYSNTFGRSSIYPLVFLNYKFKPKWAVQLLLPVSAQLVFTPNDKNVFYFSNKLEGDNYNLEFETLKPTTLYLEKADVKSFLTYEREVYDFFWIGVSGGMRFNLSFDVSDSDLYFDRPVIAANRDHIVISNEVGISPFFRVGIFLVPPRSWSE